MFFRTIHFVALGCPKNQVDTERMAGLAQEVGLELTGDPDTADVIVVNTCGFIEPAKEESIETILRLAELKRDGRCRLLVMAGCLSQRYPDELAAELPEVDHFIGTADLPRLAKLLGTRVSWRVSVGPPEGLEEEGYSRSLLPGRPSAYLKISEGCDRKCAFCVIPQIRGRQRSRAIDKLVEEAGRLAASGVRELNLVAQDTTAYGADLSPRPHLEDLLTALQSVEGLAWLRVLYTYPSAVDQQLIEALRDLPKAVPYLDIPVQHVDDQLLQRMRRGYTGAQVRQLIARLRQRIPDLFLRTTLLVGHPGETADSHRALLDFVAEVELDHLGVFPFSAEEGTAAATQDGQVPAETTLQRVEEVMELQRRISRGRLARLLDRAVEVLVEGTSPESPYLTQGRHAGQAPEVDGVVVLTSCQARPGDLVQARITDSGDYDLVAEPLQGC